MRLFRKIFRVLIRIWCFVIFVLPLQDQDLEDREVGDSVPCFRCFFTLPVRARCCKPSECGELDVWLKVYADSRRNAQCKDGKSFKE